MLIIICLTVFICFFVFNLVKIIRLPQRLKELPCVPLWGSLVAVFKCVPYDEFSRALFKDLLDKHHIVTAWHLGQWQVVVSSKEAAKQIYSDVSAFPKYIFSDKSEKSVLSKFLGINVAFSNGDIWKRHRKIVSSPFKRTFDPEVFGDLAFKLVEIINSHNGKLFSLHPLIQRLTMDALGKAALGLNFGSLQKPDVPFIRDYNTIMESINPLYFIFPFLETKSNPFRKRYHLALENLELYFSQVLEVRRKELSYLSGFKENADLLTSLILAKTEDNFTDKELRDNIMVFLVAGQDTTAFSLSAAMYLLATHPHIQDSLRKEIINTLGSNTTIPTHEQLQKMRYLASFIKETLRLFPPIARLPARICAEDTVIEGFQVPKGTKIVIDTFRLQRDSANWENPEECVPTRFLNTEFSQDPASVGFAWCPFGGYSRSCLGASFSLLEQKVVLVVLLSNFTISPQENGQQLNLSSSSLLIPKDLSLAFTPRRFKSD